MSLTVVLLQQWTGCVAGQAHPVTPATLDTQTKHGTTITATLSFSQYINKHIWLLRKAKKHEEMFVASSTAICTKYLPTHLSI